MKPKTMLPEIIEINHKFSPDQIQNRRQAMYNLIASQDPDCIDPNTTFWAIQMLRDLEPPTK